MERAIVLTKPSTVKRDNYVLAVYIQMFYMGNDFLSPILQKKREYRFNPTNAPGGGALQYTKKEGII